jgi:hypothetical protein
VSSPELFRFDGIIEPAAAAALRARVRPLLEPFWLPDRGRYLIDETHVEPELFRRLAALATERLASRVEVRAARWTRLAHGDYALYKDDARRWDGQNWHIEVSLDFSDKASEEAQIVYISPLWTEALSQRPAAGAIVDRRSGAVYRYERYVGMRFGAGEIFRLALALAVV